MLIGPGSLLSTLKTIYQLVDETTRQKGPTHPFSTMNTHRSPSLNTNTTRSNNQVREEIPTRLEEVNLEDISILFLCTYSTQPNWKQIISTCNDYGQTLAHIAVTLGYSRLLQHLIRWQIHLDAVDSTGLTALHYAYLFQQEECAKVLIHSGVDQFILDDLGRSPSDLDPSLEVRLRSITDMNSDSGADGAPPVECDTEMPDGAGKLHARHSLIRQWMPQGKDERRGEVPLFRCQSQKASSPERKVSTQPTPERHCGVSINQLDMLLPNRSPTRICSYLNHLGEQERLYICTEEFANDDIPARLGLDFDTKPQVDGPSHTVGLNIAPNLSEASTSDPSFPLFDVTAQPSIEFDAMASLAALGAPLPTNTGWEQIPQHISSTIDMSLIVPQVMPWSTWSEIPAKEGLNGTGSAITELNALSPEILVTARSPQLHLGPQGHAIDSSLISLRPPLRGRPIARTAPTILFRGTAPDAPLSYDAPITFPPSTPHGLFVSERESSPSTSPFLQSHDVPRYGNHPGSIINSRLRSASVSTSPRGRQPRRMVERVLDPVRVQPHIPAHADVTQCPTSDGISSTPQHLGVPLFDCVRAHSRLFSVTIT